MSGYRFNTRNILGLWLHGVAISHVFGGLSLSFNFPASLWQSYRDQLATIFNMAIPMTTEVASLLILMTQLFGATLASWGILMFYLVHRTIYYAESSARRTLIVAVVVWFLLDTTISVQAGVVLHFYINLFAVLAITVPLLLLPNHQKTDRSQVRSSNQ